MNKINPIRKSKVKSKLKSGMNAKQAMIEAGYSVNTAIKSTANKVVKVSQAEIAAELKASDVTVEFVLKRLNEDRELALEKGDLSTATRVDELIGRYIAMFTDKKEVKDVTQEQLWSEFQKDRSRISIPDMVDN